MILVFLGVL